MNLKPLPEPLNANERLLHGIILRQDVLIEQMNSIIDHIAKKDNIAVVESKATEKVAEPVKKEEVREENPKQTSRKRTAKIKE